MVFGLRPLRRIAALWPVGLSLLALVYLLVARSDTEPLRAPEGLPARAPAAAAQAPAQSDPAAQTRRLADYLDPLVPYPGASMVSLGDRLAASGVPMKVAFGITRDSPERVLLFYQQSLTRRGYQPQRVPFGQGVEMVSTVDERRRLALSAAALSRPDGDTEVRLTVADVERGRFDFAAPEDLPFVPGSGGFLVTESNEPGERGRTVQAVNWASVDENAGYYRKALGEKGWKLVAEEGPTPPRQTRRLRFERPREGIELQVYLEPLEERTGSSVFLAQRWPAKEAP